MDFLEVVGFGLAALGFAVAAAISGRLRGELGYWAWAWAALLGAGAVAQLPGDRLAASIGICLLNALFAGLQLAGALEHVGRLVPRWLIPAAGAVGLLRGAMTAADFATLSHLAVLPFELAALLGAAYVVHQRHSRKPLATLRWLLVLGLASLAAAEAADAIMDYRTGPAVSWALWLSIGIPVATCQILATFDRMQRAVAESLSQRELALLALEDSNERFRAIAEHAYDMIVEANAEQRIRYANPRVYELLGCGRDELLGRPFRDVLWDAELPDLNGDVSADRRPGPRRARISGPEERWIESSVHRYRTLDDEERIVIIGRDVTERVRIDEQMRKSQKLESLGTFAGGIAHDFNNLLTGILSNADIARTRIEDDHPAREQIENVLESAQLAGHLTRQLQAYAGGSVPEMRPLDVSAEIRANVELLTTAVGEHVKLGFELDEDLPAVDADPDQLIQAVLNLAVNGAEATGARPARIRIETGSVDLQPPLPPAATGELRPGRYVFVEVADEGLGIDGNIGDKLFDPFFSTKATGRGLGLAVVHGLVKTHHAAITLSSSPNAGARFRLLIPASAGKVRARPSAVQSSQRGSDGILVVDDNASVRGAVRTALTECGYSVFTASDGAQAEKIVAERGNEIALVLLDAVMPGESGDQVLERLRARRADLPVLLMSGYAESEAMGSFASNGSVSGFLSKPFRIAELTTRVRAAIDESRRS